MTRPRSEIVDVSKTAYYHVTTRCVRRAYLYGKDPVTGKDYSHRKEWMVDRIKLLTQAFSINVCAYAIMSNHYHLVLHIDTHRLSGASEEELLMRWGLIYPRDAKFLKNKFQSLTDKDKKISLSELRNKLSDMSWFMRSLNEYISKRSNKEDNLNGRFWDARFNSQALMDDGAVLSAMAYVDLNPVRAMVATTPESSDYTSIQERILLYAKSLKQTKNREASAGAAVQPHYLMPFKEAADKDNTRSYFIDFSLSDYIELVEQTGRAIRDDKPGVISNHFAPVLERIGLTAKGWLSMTQEIESKFYYAVGGVEQLKEISAAYRNPNSTLVQYIGTCYLTED